LLSKRLFTHKKPEHHFKSTASLTVGAAFFGLWFWLLPLWLGFRIEEADAANW
jgi:hypothetical protein